MTAPYPDLQLDRQLCFAVYAASHAFTAAYKPLLEPLGLTYSQYLVLIVLWEEDGLSVKEIARRLHLESATLTPILKRLEAGGFVRRRRDPADERQLRVELTDRGWAVQVQVSEVRQRIACALGTTEEALDTLRRQVEALIPLLRASSGAGAARSEAELPVPGRKVESA